MWQGVFSAYRGKWLLVTLKDGTEILGYPDFYSDDFQKRELFVASATIKFKDGQKEDIEGPGILLTEKSDIKHIQFLN